MAGDPDIDRQRVAGQQHRRHLLVDGVDDGRHHRRPYPALVDKLDEPAKHAGGSGDDCYVVVGSSSPGTVSGSSDRTRYSPM